MFVLLIFTKHYLEVYDQVLWLVCYSHPTHAAIPSTWKLDKNQEQEHKCE
jgi:hypothetical protein